MRWVTCFIFIFSLKSLTAGPPCRDILKKTKDIKKVYLQLRFSGNRCKFDSNDFIFLGQRSLVAGRLAESHWAAMRGLKSHPGPVEESELKIISGTALLEMNRHEEAIIALKSVAFDDKVAQKTKERAHLLLIKA